jgi:hypothetical protein
VSTTITMRPASLDEAGLRDTIRFETPLLRTVDGEERPIIDTQTGQPITITVTGQVTYFVRRVDGDARLIEFRITGQRRTYLSRPDLPIELA